MESRIADGALTSSCDKIGKPSNDNGRTVGNLQEGQDREDHHNREAVYGHTLASGVRENARGSSFQREAVQGTNGTVGIGVTSRENGSQQETEKKRLTLAEDPYS